MRRIFSGGGSAAGVAITLAVASLALSGVLSAQLNFPEIPYDASTPLTLPPNLHLGEAAGVATNSKGNIWVAEWNSGNLSRYEPQSGKWSKWRAPAVVITGVPVRVYTKISPFELVATPAASPR